MNIFQVTAPYDQYTIIITEDMIKVLEQEVLDELGETSMITVWLDGKVLEKIKIENDVVSYDEIYLKIIKYENKKGE